MCTLIIHRLSETLTDFDLHREASWPETECQQEVQASEIEADEILAARKKASQAIRILKPYYNAGSVAKTQAEDGVDIEDKFKLDYLAPFLPQANIRTLSPSQATAARDACYQVRFCCIQYSMPPKLTQRSQTPAQRISRLLL